MNIIHCGINITLENISSTVFIIAMSKMRNVRSKGMMNSKCQKVIIFDLFKGEAYFNLHTNI